jgi:hypothetical protein
VIWAQPVAAGTALEITATLDFEEETDPVAVAKAQRKAQLLHKKILTPGTLRFGTAKTKACSPDEIIQVGLHVLHPRKYQVVFEPTDVCWGCRNALE